MNTPDDDLQGLLAELARRGVATSAQLQGALGRSQPTLSRLLQAAASRVLVLGRGRSTRYGLPQALMGHGAQQPLVWIDEDGRQQALGTLSLLQGDWLHVDVDGHETLTRGELPWFLAPLAPQGFLGRLLAQRLAPAGLVANPEQWTLPQQLFAALGLDDVPGAIRLGDAVSSALPQLPAGAGLPAALETLASDVASTLPAGSSAGGEQPKFLARGDDGHPVLVKFSPPRGTPFGERWHDLLHAEALAMQVLASHGVPVAGARVVGSSRRTYLLSPRFDRVGTHGRRHVVAIGAVHRSFVPGPWQHWAASASVLQYRRRLPPGTADQVLALLHFGRLIGNSDMHAGNLGLLVDRDGLARGRFALAPVYDMLPMRWRPDPMLGGAADYTPFEPDAAALAGPARAVALDHWLRLADHADVSRGLRRVAGQMALRLR